MAVTESTVREIELHGHPVTFRHVGQGPAVVLIHGITSSSTTWRAVSPRLAERHTVIAPRAGHFPFNDDPERFAALVKDVIATTEPAVFDDDDMRRLILRGRP